LPLGARYPPSLPEIFADDSIEAAVWVEVEAGTGFAATGKGSFFFFQL